MLFRKIVFIAILTLFCGASSTNTAIWTRFKDVFKQTWSKIKPWMPLTCGLTAGIATQQGLKKLSPKSQELLIETTMPIELQEKELEIKTTFTKDKEEIVGNNSVELCIDKGITNLFGPLAIYSPDKSSYLIGLPVHYAAKEKTDVLAATLKHELGHVKNKDAQKRAALVIADASLTGFAVGRTLVTPRLNLLTRIVATPIVAFVGLASSWLSLAKLSRHQEFNADLVAVEYGSGPQLIKGLKKINDFRKQDLEDIEPDNLQNLKDILFATHPPFEKRIAAIEKAIQKKQEMERENKL